MHTAEDIYYVNVCGESAMLAKDQNAHKLCAIISGGEADLLAGVTDAQFIVAVDYGYRYAQEQGIKPDLIIGDFDSYDADMPLLKEATRNGMEQNLPAADLPKIITLPKAKDDSDTLAALRYCLQLGYRNFRLYCALGGRLDHLFANLQACSFAAELGAAIEIVSKSAHVTFLHNSARSFPRREGFALSIFSLSDTSEGVNVKGARYELTDAELTRTFPIGLSNEWATNEVVAVSVARGTLIVVESSLYNPVSQVS